jgi:hypothetical protein
MIAGWVIYNCRSLHLHAQNNYRLEMLQLRLLYKFCCFLSPSQCQFGTLRIFLYLIAQGYVERRCEASQGLLLKKHFFAFLLATNILPAMAVKTA